MAGEGVEMSAKDVSRGKLCEEILEDGLELDCLGDRSLFVEVFRDEGIEQSAVSFDRLLVIMKRPALASRDKTRELAAVDAGEKIKEVFEDHACFRGDALRIVFFCQTPFEEFDL